MFEVARIALNGKRRLSPEQSALVRLFLEALHRRLGPDALVCNSRYAEALQRLGIGAELTGPSVDRLSPGDVQLAVSIGGDGTLLKTSRWAAPANVPVLGVNSGHLGYLTEGALNDVDALADDIATGRLVRDFRIQLHVKALNPEISIPAPFALNEVAVTRASGSASLIRIGAMLDGAPLADYPADGLIISTPTGSTAYNLSVGGPVIAPSTPALCISPIAPHALTMRPIVVPDTSVITLSVDARDSEYLLAMDGRSVTLPTGCRLEVKKARVPVVIARRIGTNFADTLRTKLMWGVDPR